MPSDNPHIILIDGKSGVGKSSLARTMAESLGATVVHLDDAYPGWGGLEGGRDAIIHSVLAPVAAGLMGRFRSWDWERDIAGAIVEVEPADIVVFEGCGISTAKSRELASTVLWVECPESDRLARLRQRDGGEYDQHFLAWDTQVDAHIAANAPVTTANVVVCT